MDSKTFLNAPNENEQIYKYFSGITDENKHCMQNFDAASSKKWMFRHIYGFSVGRMYNL